MYLLTKSVKNHKWKQVEKITSIKSDGFLLFGIISFIGVFQKQDVSFWTFSFSSFIGLLCCATNTSEPNTLGGKSRAHKRSVSCMPSLPTSTDRGRTYMSSLSPFFRGRDSTDKFFGEKKTYKSSHQDQWCNHFVLLCSTWSYWSAIKDFLEQG